MIKIKKQIKHSSLTSGVLILLISNIVVKLVGVMFKIPLVGILGDGGMGYFNSAYTVYTLFYTLSSAGLPVALSILISKCDTEERYSDKARVYRVTLMLFGIMGLIFSLFMSLGSEFLGNFIGNPQARTAILAISPVMFFVCITSARRGYFQGVQNMLPTAVSQLMQALGKLGFGILFATIAIKNGYAPPVSAAFAILGITVSEALCMLLLMLFRRNAQPDTGRYTISVKQTLKMVVKTALPITVSSAVLSLTNMLDLSIVMKRLIETGHSPEEANALFGNYTGLAVPMFNLPAALITPIALGIVPYITAALSKKQEKEALSIMRSSVKSSLIIAFPCAFGMSVLSEPILKLIFDDSQAMRAADHLSILSLATVGVAVTTVTTAILQSTGRSVFPIISMSLGCVIKLISGYFLIGEYGMMGTPVSTLLCYFATSVLNVVYIILRVGKIIRVWDGFIKPMVCGALCAGTGYWINTLLANKVSAGIGCILAIGGAGIVYVVLALVLSLMNYEDTRVFPGGKYIEKIMIKGKNRNE